MLEDQRPPLRFSNERKLRKQMRRRKWTEVEIHEALAQNPEQWQGKKGPALRYRHPTSGKVLLVDKTTGEIFHVGGGGFKYDG